MFCLGKLTLGSSRDADISVVGTGVESIHCTIENNNGVVTLHPINGTTAVDGVSINSPVRLAQGKTLTQIRITKYKLFVNLLLGQFTPSKLNLMFCILYLYLVFSIIYFMYLGNVRRKSVIFKCVRYNLKYKNLHT